MALISCPKCKGTVSSTAHFCPHCGYSLNTIAAGYVRCPECGTMVDDDANFCTNCGYRMITTAPSILTSNLLDVLLGRTGYDVMLVDYSKAKYLTKSYLSTILDISQAQANVILGQVPCYLYTDISQDDAEYIARACQSRGMRVAVYSPAGRVQYYTPVDYNKALPVLSHVIRKALFKTPPVRKQSVYNQYQQTIFHIKKDPKVDHNPAPNVHTGFNNMNQPPKPDHKPNNNHDHNPKQDNKPKKDEKPKPEDKPNGSSRPDHKPGNKK